MREPSRVFRPKCLLQFFTQTPCQRRASSGGGNGNLQLAAADNRGIVEIAERRHIDDVAKDVAGPRFAVDGAMRLLRIGSSHDQKHAVEVFGLECPLFEVDFPAFVPLHDCACGARSYNADARARFQEAGDFSFADLARTDNEAAAATQLQKERKEVQGCRAPVCACSTFQKDSQAILLQHSGG